MQNYQERILPQTYKVMQSAQHVHIHTESLNKLADKILSSSSEINREWTELDFKYHYTDGSEKTAQWLLLSSALNFSFWDGNAEELWETEYEGEWVKGYWALTSSLKKAVNTHDILNATFLENMTEDTLKDILQGHGEAPLLKKRVKVCQNIGRVLNEKFDGEFINAINQANNSAVTLTNIVANNFEDFRDISKYKDQEVAILKRAQILVADLWGAFSGKSHGKFNDIDNLTIFADYKLPQFLQALNVLTYSEELLTKIKHYEIIEQGSEMEIELRAATIQAINQLKEKTNRKFSALQLDWWIWNESFKAEFEKVPHHLTRSVYY